MPFYSTFYQILEISGDAWDEDIKSAYRRLALVYHPDKNGNSPESHARFIVLHQAYDTLSDSVKRREYDRFLRTSATLNPKNRSVSRALPGKSQPSRESLFAHLNVVLWDIEDFLRTSRRAGSPDELQRLLVFFDKWILTPAGFPDYFLQARGIEPGGFDFISPASRGHRPFIDLDDYFYNLRMRADKLLNRIALMDILKPLPNVDLRLIDCLIEFEAYAVHTLSGLTATEGDASIAPFKYSRPEFER